MTQLSLEPFPHAVIDGFLGDDQYQALLETYPSITTKREQGRTGYDIYRDDPEYSRLMAARGDWAMLHFQLCSGGFVDYMLDTFDGHLPDVKEMRFVDFVETRAMLYSREKIPKAPAGELFVRMDIQSGRIGYEKPAHLDHDRRVASMLLYFCDREEANMVGGELVLHRPDGTAVKEVEPRHNRAVIWPQVRNSYHSVNKIVTASKPRRFLYVTVSSRVSVWPRTRKTL